MNRDILKNPTLCGAKNSNKLGVPSLLVTRKSLIRVLCALFEEIPFGMNRDILKNPTLCGAKNSNKLGVPVFWSRGFPTLSIVRLYKTNRPRVVGWCEGVVYLMSPGRPNDIGLQLGKACYPCSR